MLFSVRSYLNDDTIYHAHTGPVTMASDSGRLSDAAVALSAFLPPVAILPTESEATVTARTDATLAEEGFTLTVKDGRAVITHATYRGLVGALAALSLLVRYEDGQLLLPDVALTEAPAARHRGVMLDVARGVMPMARMIEDVVLAAKAGMNVLHLHLSDSRGTALELTSLPTEYRLKDPYTREEIAALLSLCRALGLEVIPEFDMPAHSRLLLNLFPQLACDVDAEYTSFWTVCGGNEEAYALYERIIAEIADWFPEAKYLHIGGDEIEFRDIADKEALPRFCHWQECRRCRALREREGLGDRQDQWYYFINRINAIVKKHGKRTVIWSDQIDCQRPKGIDGDVLLHFWRIAWPGRGPYEGCTMQKQLDMGYELINSYFPRTYIDLESYVSSANLATWRWDEDPECREDTKGQILGSELAAWEYGNVAEYPHYAYSLPSGIFLMGEKLWSGEKRPYTEADETDLTRAVLGAACPEGLNVFRGIGDILPPRRNTLAYPHKVTLTDGELRAMAKTLETVDLLDGGAADRALVYRDCINYVLAARAEAQA